MNKLHLAEFSAQSIELFGKTKKLFASSVHDNIRQKTNEVPNTFVDEGKKINIVFAGQYSAGKSSILSILTGQHLTVGQGVTTDKCQTLDWNGIHITDTPGIHTQKRPDHDKITYQAISEADLIVFVVTNEGFSDHLGKHFRKLLVEHGKGAEMMLVVNKMESSEGGNTPEQQQIFIDKNLKPVISPEYTPEQLYTCFVDAKAYENAQKETDEEEKKWLLKVSGIDNLICVLNQFVKQKDFLGRCTTSLYKEEQLLSDALTEFKSDDYLTDGAIYLLNRQRRMLTTTIGNIKNGSYNIVRRHTQEVRRWGEDIANELSSASKEQEVNDVLTEKYEETNRVYREVANEFKIFVETENEKLQKDIKEFEDTSFVKDFRVNYEKEKVKVENFDPKKTASFNKYANKTAEYGEAVFNMSRGANAGTGWASLFKVSAYSGSKIHTAVKEVGHFFGHKFKPWEAVKITKNIGIAGKFLGVAGAFVGVLLQLKADRDEEKAEKSLLEVRSGIRCGFNAAANVIDMEFDKQTQTWIEKTYNPIISEIDQQTDELRQTMNIHEEEYKTYQDLLQQTRSLIKQIHDLSA